MAADTWGATYRQADTAISDDNNTKGVIEEVKMLQVSFKYSSNLNSFDTTYSKWIFKTKSLRSKIKQA